MEVVTEPQQQPQPHFETTAPDRASSALGHNGDFKQRQPKKKISFSKKLSTFSLHNSSTSSEDAASMIPEDAPLQRRNSIHNVPYVDVNDPQTRERMERYKEERRSLLRAKYKVEDYMTSETTNKYRRKSTEAKNEISPASSAASEAVVADENIVILRKEQTNSPPMLPDSPVREVGVIDEDVNVKERAAMFGGCQQISALPKYNRTKSWNSTTSNSIAVPKNNIMRPMSDIVNNRNNRKMSPGSPSKIRDMAAFFEQQK